MTSIAVKIKSVPHWLWFEAAKTAETEDRFIGKEGWGADGKAVNVDVPPDILEGRIESDALMHDEI